MAKKEENENLEELKTEETTPKKSSGGLGLVPILGIVFGSLLILILATRFLFLPYIVENLGGNKNDTSETKKEEIKTATKGPFAGVEKQLIKFIETGRITTNPLNSDQFVVVNLGLRFYAQNENVLKEIFGESKEGATLPPDFMAQIRGKINQMLGSLTVTELQQRRNQFANEFKDSLKTIFANYELVLGEVFLQEFIIQ